MTASLGKKRRDMTKISGDAVVSLIFVASCEIFSMLSQIKLTQEVLIVQTATKAK
jgi:hypothetical protein